MVQAKKLVAETKSQREKENNEKQVELKRKESQKSKDREKEKLVELNEVSQHEYGLEAPARAYRRSLSSKVLFSSSFENRKSQQHHIEASVERFLRLHSSSNYFFNILFIFN